MKFTKMTDSQWQTIRPHLPKPAKTGMVQDVMIIEQQSMQ